MNKAAARPSSAFVRPARTNHARLGALAVAALVSTSAGAQPTQAGSFPLLATKLMLKVLTYDKAFESRGSGDFVVVVATEAGQSAQRAALLDALAAARLGAILSRPLKFAPLDFVDRRDFEAQVQKLKPSAVLALSGISPAAADAISNVSATQNIYALTTDQSLAQRGFVVAVGEEKGKPLIVINVQTAKAIGASFEQSILKLARVVH